MRTRLCACLLAATLATQSTANEHSLGVLGGNELMLERAIAHCPLQVVVNTTCFRKEVTKVTHTTDSQSTNMITQPDDFCLCVQFTILNSPSSHPLEQNLKQVPLNHDVGTHWLALLSEY